MFARAAGHMITPFILVNDDATLGAAYCTNLLLPLLEMMILFRLTTIATRMGLLTAGKAHACLAVTANHIVDILVFMFSYVSFASRIWTPS